MSQKLGNAVLILIVLSVYACLLLYYPFSFNFEVEINSQYFLLFFAVIYSILYIGFIWINKLDLTPLQGVVHFIALLFLTYTAAFDRAFLSNEPLCVFFSLLLFAIPFLYYNAKLYDWIWSGLLFIYVIQLSLGLSQFAFANFITGACKGTLRNSGIYTVYITLHLPVVNYFLKSRLTPKRPGLSRLIFSIILLLSISITVINNSRTGMLMITVILLWLLFQIASRSLTSKVKLVLLICLVSSLVLALFYFLLTIKMPSAYGRILAFEVTAAHLRENIWFGVGFGKFSSHYPYWQELYFRSTPGIPTAYLLSAGETYIILNIYLLLLAEVGVIGCLLLLTLLVYFFKYKPKYNQMFINMNKQVVVLILIAGLTSYPLNVSPIIFIFLLCLFPVGAARPAFKWFTAPFFRLKGAYIAALTVMFVFVFRKARAVHTWQNLRNSESFSYPETIQRYRGLYPQMKNDSKFLTEYGEELLKEVGYCKEALLVFNRARQMQITRRLVNNSANACKCLGKYEEAIKGHQFLSYLLPSRFTPKYEMLMLYLEIKDTARASQAAKQILEMPIKIPSDEVERIRNMAKTTINSRRFIVYPTP